MKFFQTFRVKYYWDFPHDTENIDKNLFLIIFMGCALGMSSSFLVPTFWKTPNHFFLGKNKIIIFDAFLRIFKRKMYCQLWLGASVQGKFIISCNLKTIDCRGWKGSFKYPTYPKSFCSPTCYEVVIQFVFKYLH